jgi:hypothetical protein
MELPISHVEIETDDGTTMEYDLLNQEQLKNWKGLSTDRIIGDPAPETEGRSDHGG